MALAKRHPFREFVDKAERMGLLQDWYDFKYATEMTMAQEWLNDHDLEITDNKIVRAKNSIIPNPAYDPLFDDEYLDEDCCTIADNISDVLLNLEEAYKAGARELAIKQMLQLAWANCSHFITEEHWCYFDDVYSPEMRYYPLLELIAKDIKTGHLPESLTFQLYDGFKSLSKTECVKSYGCLDLQECLSSILHRVR